MASAGRSAALLVLGFLLIGPGISSPHEAWAQSPTGGGFAQHDVRGRSEEGIIAASVSSSMQTVALVVRTSDQAVWPVAFQTAQALSRDGYPVSFLLAADGPDQLDVYARGIAVSRIRDPGTSQQAIDTIRTEMVRAYNLAFGD